MALEDRAALRIHHTIDAMSVLNKMLDKYGAEEIAADTVLRMAFERGFEIVSEASRHVPKELKAIEPEID